MFRLLSRLRAPFSKSKLYAERKAAKLAENLDLRLVPKSSMLQVSLPITNIVPGFFSKSLDCRLTIEQPVKTQGTNIPSNSYAEITLPLSTDSYFNMIFQRLQSKHLRVGRILEVMDSAAGIAGYRYNFCKEVGHANFILATASVDSINIFEELSLNQDILFRTYVTFVGKTSMEVEVSLEQEQKLRASALFTMVARQKSDIGKPYLLPQLNLLEEPDMPKAKLRAQRGFKHRQQRIEEGKKAFDKSIPQKQEIAQLITVLGKHLPFGKPLKIKQHSSVRPSVFKMKQTFASKSILMHTQDRNIQGKIFGGFLVREMIELAWFSCMKVSKGKQLTFKDIQDLEFHEPVQVGDGLVVDSVVCYVEGGLLVVRVTASKLKFASQQLIKTCELHIILGTVDGSHLDHVIPETFEEGLIHIMGKRKLQHMYI